MNPRQRVLSTLNHKEPDKTPIDLGASVCSSLTLEAYLKLKEFLDTKNFKIDYSGEAIANQCNESINIPEELMKLFEIEFRPIRMKGPKVDTALAETKEKITSVGDSSPLIRAPEGDIITDEFGTKWRKVLYDYVCFYYPLANTTYSELDKIQQPDPYNPGRIEGLREEAKKLRETDYAIVADFICAGPFECAQRIRGFEAFFMDLCSDYKYATKLLDILTDNAIGFMDALLSSLGDLVDIVVQGDDLGAQNGLQISPEMYRRFIKPCHKRFFDFIHSKTEAKLFLHTCGSVYDIIPDLIEVGVDILNPVQTGARNMGLKLLKKDFGKDITFWGGGIDIQKLPFMSINDIEKIVKENLEIMATGGGYVFCATHNILPETDGIKTYNVYNAAVKNR